MVTELAKLWIQGNSKSIHLGDMAPSFFLLTLQILQPTPTTIFLHPLCGVGVQPDRGDGDGAGQARHRGGRARRRNLGQGSRPSDLRPKVPCFFEKMSYAQLFLTKLKKVLVEETKKLKIDPRSVSGACLKPLIDYKVAFRDVSMTQNRPHISDARLM